MYVCREGSFCSNLIDHIDDKFMEGFLYNVCTFYNIQKNYFHCVFLIFGNESQKVTIKDVET